MKKLIFALAICLGFIFFLKQSCYAQKQIIRKDEVSISQQVIIPEKLWKTECQGMAQNANLLRLPLNDGTLGVMFTRKDTIHYPFIFVGNICELVKGYNNSTFYIGVGQALIKPCSGSDEEAIEISSQGLEFIYHTGIGLEYISGNGTIKMLGKSYELRSESSLWQLPKNLMSLLNNINPCSNIINLQPTQPVIPVLLIVSLLDWKGVINAG